MIVRRDFLDHWKTRKLRELLGYPHVSDHLIALWAHCETSKAWTFSCDEEQMARICRHTGSDYKGFVDAMITARFIDRINGQYVVHDWDKYNGRLLHNWQSGAKGGRPRTHAPNNKPEKYKHVTASTANVISIGDKSV
jgi:hypothetical protein